VDATAERDFREYVAGRQASLFRMALLLARNHEQAEDLAQSVLARLARYWPRVSRAENIDAYVRKLMYHEHVSWWNRRRRQEGTTERQPDRPPPEDLAASVALRLRLHEALQQLPTQQRAAVVLRYYEDLPEREVATIMGCAVGTVRSHTARALVKLRASCPDLAFPETSTENEEAAV
jgi:RNA polymerase sigma-70 factor (sigma-E family)